MSRPQGALPKPMHLLTLPLSESVPGLRVLPECMGPIGRNWIAVPSKIGSILGESWKSCIAKRHAPQVGGEASVSGLYSNKMFHKYAYRSNWRKLLINNIEYVVIVGVFLECRRFVSVQGDLIENGPHVRLGAEFFRHRIRSRNQEDLAAPGSATSRKL